ncbi:hypothetical protein [Sphingomonas montana]|uniref:hypothetical protein n=1 Tax=Sphingomonas montana TaxID=1843236 RepID=UPI00096CE82F|nr:hypothetical protein [Sphingomonas montana]
MTNRVGAPGADADIGTVIERTLAGLRREWRPVLIWCAMMAGLGVLSSILLLPLMARQAAVMAGASGGFQPGVLAGLGAIGVLTSLLCVAIVVAAMRSVLQPYQSRPAWLRFGGTELRVLAVMLLLGFGIYLALVVTIILLAGLIGAANATLGGVTLAAAVVMGGALIVAAPFCALYCWVRLSLAVPLTVQRGRIAIRDAWRLGRGRFWFLLLGYVLLGLMAMVALMPAIAVQIGDMGTMMPAAGDPAAVQRAMATRLAQLMHPAPATLIVNLLLGGLGNGVAMALQGGMAAELLLAIQADGARPASLPADPV